MKDIIPNVNDMEDEIFKKHANARHVSPDGFLAAYTNIDTSASVLDLGRAAHDHWHDKHPEKFDHDHLEES